jgi:predicted DNA-binding protein with PD1-like motif
MSETKKESSEMYRFHEGTRGREFYLILRDGVDLLEGITTFVKDKKIRIAKVHAALEGSFQPTKIEYWTPDTRDPSNWHNMSVASFESISQICSLSGIIHPRIVDGKERTVVKLHGTIGGGWDAPIAGGHFREGTKVKGVLGIFITEILGMDKVIKP